MRHLCSSVHRLLLLPLTEEAAVEAEVVQEVSMETVQEHQEQVDNQEDLAEEQVEKIQAILLDQEIVHQ